MRHYRFLTDENFRSITNGFVFLFINSEYEGAYRDTGAALEHVAKMGYYGDGITPIYIRPMYFRYFDELMESNISYSYRERIFMEQLINGQLVKLDYDHQKYFRANISFGSIDIPLENESINNVNFIIDIMNIDDYIIDSACTHTHAPYPNYLNSTTYRYNDYPYNANNEEIKDENLKKNCSQFNKQIIYVTKGIFKSANDQPYTKIMIYLDNNTTITVNDASTLLKLFTAPILLYEKEIKIPIEQSKLDKLLGKSQEFEIIIKILRHTHFPQYLLGLDVICKLCLTLELYDLFHSKLIIKSCFNPNNYNKDNPNTKFLFYNYLCKRNAIIFKIL